MTTASIKCALAGLLFFGTGCSSFIDSALNGAGNNAGNRAGNAAANSIMGPPGSGGMTAATMPPATMNLYLGQIFSLAFSPGGYSLGDRDYKPGEYTRWDISNEEGKKDATLERAHLFDDASGNQWWRVKWFSPDEKPMVIEGLLNPTQNRFVRMRAKFPEDTAPQELPVDEQNYYHPPQKLSRESIEGATVGTESVTVPAGTFTARHVVFGQAGLTHESWLDSKVPGGSVRQATKSEKTVVSEMKLIAFGTDAKSELGVK